MVRPKLSLLIALALPVVGVAGCSNGGHASQSASSHSAGSASPSARTGGDSTSGTVKNDTTVAIVNGHKIKGAAYNRMVTQVRMQAEQQSQGGRAPSAKQTKKQAMNTVVGTELLVQDADAHGFTASKSAIHHQVKQVTARYKSAKALKQALQKNDLTMPALRSEAADQIKIAAYVKKELGPFTVSNKQITSYYSQLKAQQGSTGSRKASIPPLKKVKPQIKQQLQSQLEQQRVSAQVAKLKKKGTVKILI